MHLPSLRRSIAVAAVASSVALPLAIGALLPSNVMPKNARGLNRREGPIGLKAGVNIGQLVQAVMDFLKGENAYDPSVPGKCILYFGTTAGGSCSQKIQCEESDDPGTDPLDHPWNVCYLNGRQFFNHPDLGDFSITYTKAGGIDGNKQDGLHHPVIQMANLNNWEPINVQDIIDGYGERDEGCLATGPKKDANQHLGWKIGLPKLGEQAFGLSNLAPDPPGTGFKPGWCTAHVAQWQKNEFGNGPNFAFDVQIFDAAGTQIGILQHANVDNGGHLSVDSRLPYTLDITVGPLDQSYVTFAYAGVTWTCDDKDGGDHDCTLGNGKELGYENGDREGDMGWTC